MNVLLFDDECLVCNRAVQFLLARDEQLYFAALQGEYGQQIVQRHQLEHIDSVILVENDRVYTHSTAALRALRFVPKWRILLSLQIVPAPIRDRVYKLIARNRKRFQQSEQCLFLNDKQRTRFLP